MHKSYNICTSPLLHLLWLGRWLLTETMWQPHHKECQRLGGHAVTAEPTAAFLRMKERIWGLKEKNVLLLCCTVTFTSIQCCCPQKTRKVSFSPRWWPGIEAATYSQRQVTYDPFGCQLYIRRKILEPESHWVHFQVHWYGEKVIMNKNLVSINFEELLKLLGCCKIISA